MKWYLRVLKTILESNFLHIDDNIYSNLQKHLEIFIRIVFFRQLGFGTAMYFLCLLDKRLAITNTDLIYSKQEQSEVDPKIIAKFINSLVLPCLLLAIKYCEDVGDKFNKKFWLSMPHSYLDYKEFNKLEIDLFLRFKHVLKISDESVVKTIDTYFTHNDLIDILFNLLDYDNAIYFGDAIIKVIDKKVQSIGLFQLLRSNPSRDNNSLFHLACARGSLSIVQIFLSYALEVLNTYDAWQSTGLFYAVIYKRLSVIKLLLSQDANPNIRSYYLLVYPNGNCSTYMLTPLEYAFMVGSAELIKILWKYAKNLMLDKTQLGSWLINAASQSRLDLVQILIDMGVDVNFQNTEGKTAIIIAAINGNLEMLCHLISHGGNVNELDFSGTSAIGYLLCHEIQLASYPAMIRILSSAGALINEMNIVNSSYKKLLKCFNLIKKAEMTLFRFNHPSCWNLYQQANLLDEDYVQNYYITNVLSGAYQLHQNRELAQAMFDIFIDSPFISSTTNPNNLIVLADIYLKYKEQGKREYKVEIIQQVYEQALSLLHARAMNHCDEYIMSKLICLNKMCLASAKEHNASYPFILN